MALKDDARRGAALNDDTTRFAFGRNWASYARSVGEREVTEASEALARLLGTRSLAGKSFLDIGCGSGLHSVAALRMGADRVMAVDLDSDSVETSRAMLGRLPPQQSWDVRQASVFDLSPDDLGRFDVVYSWGVLHHTGDLDRAVRNAAAMVDGDGLFAFALYRRTRLCRFWTAEKRWYAHARPWAQRVARGLYIAWYHLLGSVGRLLGRRGLDAPRARGMDFAHDVHDWLGGYPYESILPDDVERLMSELGLRHEATLLCAPSRGPTRGLLGSGCDEYRYLRARTQ